MLALPCRTVDDRNVVRFGIASHASAEPAGQPHQMRIVQGFVRSRERPPPHTETAGTMPHAEIGIQNNAIHAIVVAAQQVVIEVAQPVWHRMIPPGNCPTGATFPQQRLRKSVGHYPQKHSVWSLPKLFLAREPELL